MPKRNRKKKKLVDRNQYTLNSIIENEIKENHIRTDFPKKINFDSKYSKLIKSKVHSNMTHIPFVTIDGDDSKDFDDAVYALPLKDKINIMVAIADVSFFVKENDFIDLEAKKRANSFYFPNKVIPMLPDFLSSDLCSLVPNKSRLCIIVNSYIDYEGKLISYEIIRGVIKSKGRLTYSQVENYLNKLKYPEDDNYSKIIKNLKCAYLSLKKMSIKRGKIDLNLEEVKIESSKNKAFFSFSKNKHLFSEKIIEELMIFANNIVATFFFSKKIKSIYRNHEKPNDEKILKLRKSFKLLNIEIKNNKLKTQKDFLKILSLGNNPYFKLIKESILRSQSKAFYHYKNIGHFGLALKNYTHFTSPIRRYSDLLVHRSISKELFGNKNLIIDISDSVCSYLLKQEKKSELIERNIIEKACCLYLTKIKRKNFTGFIDGLTEFGIFIKAVELPFSGLLRLNTINDDFYDFDNKNFLIKGRNHGKLFLIGQKVSFKIKSVNVSKGQITLNKIEKIES